MTLVKNFRKSKENDKVVIGEITGTDCSFRAKIGNKPSRRGINGGAVFNLEIREKSQPLWRAGLGDRDNIIYKYELGCGEIYGKMIALGILNSFVEELEEVNRKNASL